MSADQNDDVLHEKAAAALAKAPVIDEAELMAKAQAKLKAAAESISGVAADVEKTLTPSAEQVKEPLPIEGAVTQTAEDCGLNPDFRPDDEPEQDPIMAALASGQPLPEVTDDEANSIAAGLAPFVKAAGAPSTADNLGKTIEGVLSETTATPVVGEVIEVADELPVVGTVVDAAGDVAEVGKLARAAHEISEGAKEVVKGIEDAASALMEDVKDKLTKKD